MIKRIGFDNEYGRNRDLCWDEENRLTTVRDFNGEPPLNLSSYIYNAGGDRTWKLTGPEQTMLINGETTIQLVDYAKTLYSSPYMVMTESEYSKHYFIEGVRICTKLGSGFELAPTFPIDNDIEPIEGTIIDISKLLREMVNRSVACTGYESWVEIDPDLEPAYWEGNEPEANQYFYHSDHLGSSSFITNINGSAIQHLQYLPFGETFIDERENDPFNTPYKFSGKEKDDETQYSYFGARYYDSDLSVWLSVDPLANKYPSMSPFMYCAGNPVILVDPDGREPILPFAGTIGGFMKFFNNLSTGIAGSSGTNAHQAMLRMGEVNWSLSGPSPKNTGPFNTCHIGEDNTKGNRYIYTENGGWIDMSHFMFYAGRAYGYKQEKQLAQDAMKQLGDDKYGVGWAIMKSTTLNPVGEAVQDGYMQEYFDQYGPTYSAYSYEDLPSDKFGADFGANYFDPNSKQTFGEQLQNYFNNVLKATNPENAPNYNSLPATYPTKGQKPSTQNHSTKPMFTTD